MTSLMPRFTLGSLDLTEYPFGVVFGSDLGNPEQVSDVLASLLADGEIESRSRRSNRTITLPVLIEGSDLAALAEAEAALIAECDKQQNTLTLDPGDGFGPATVFETFSADPQRVYDDDTEQSGYRRWTVTIKALPYGRSVDKIIDNAGSPPSSGTVVYSAESTTGWSAVPFYSSQPPEYVVDTTIKAEGTGSVRSRIQSWRTDYYPEPSQSSLRDKLTGLSISTGTGGYLSVAIRPEWRLLNLEIYVTTTTGGRELVPSPIAVKRDANGFVHYAWLVEGGLTVTEFEFFVSQAGPIIGSLGSTTAPPHHVWYDDFEFATAATSDHQIVKQLAVEGSARTVGSLHIASPLETIALGQVLAITAPTSVVQGGFRPDARRWITQGTTTADSTALDGSYVTPSTSTYDSGAGKPIFDVPVGMLVPGPYTIVGLVKAEASSLNFGVQAQLRVGSTNTSPLSTAETSPTGLTTGWQFITVGTVYLPPLPVQSADSTTKVRLLFKGAKFADVYMIPSWRVGGRPVADYSIVDCGSGAVAAGGPSSNLWIDSPSTDQPQGGWWRGPSADRANTQSAWPDAKKPGVHTFAPGELSAWLVSLGAAGPTLALEYYPAWFGAAAL